LRSFDLSASVAPPTLRIATPPVSFDIRSSNFSLSYSLVVFLIDRAQLLDAERDLLLGRRRRR